MNYLYLFMGIIATIVTIGIVTTLIVDKFLRYKKERSKEYFDDCAKYIERTFGSIMNKMEEMFNKMNH